MPATGTWIILSYPAASSCLSVKTHFSFRAQLKSSFSLMPFLLSPAGKEFPSAPWEGCALPYCSPELQSSHGMPELRFAHFFFQVSEEGIEM